MALTILGEQLGTGFISPLWRLEFWSGSYIFGRILQPWFIYTVCSGVDMVIADPVGVGFGLWVV